MEVTQGIQNLENGMPLVAERMTVVRVYVRTESDEASLADVSAGLGGWRGNQFLGVVWPENGPIIARPDGGDRLNLDDSLWFILPFDWIQPGELTLKALVFRGSPQAADQEEDPENNLISGQVSFTAVPPLSLRLVPVHLHDPPSPESPEKTYFYDDHVPDAARVLLFPLRLFPVSEVLWDASVQQAIEIPFFGEVGGTVVFPPLHHHGQEWDLSTDMDRHAVNMEIAELKTFEGKAALYYGMVDPSVPMGGYWGWASYGAAFGQMTTATLSEAPWLVQGGLTIAHELAHNLGLNHALCNGNEGPPNGQIDPGYPYPHPNCQLAAVDPAGYYGLDVYWWVWPDDVSEPTVIGNAPDGPQGQVAFPMMGYRDPWWADPYAYCLLLDALGVPCSPQTLNIALPQKPGLFGAVAGGAPTTVAPNARVQAGSGSYFLVGAVLDEGTARLSALLPIVSPSPAAIAEADERRRAMAARQGGELELRLLGADGAELARYPLAPIEPRPHHGAVAEADLVTLLVERPAGTARVELLLGGRVVDARDGSPSPPSVRFEQPAGGGELVPPVELAWSATDPDGDPLTFTLLYSADDGRSWHVVATGLGDASVRLPHLDGFPATDALRFRVVASDGFHAAEAVTADRYRIGNSPPFPVIVAPADGSTFRAGETVVFGAAALDAEDGALRGDALRWRSDRDGELGTGERLDVRTLSPGRHTVTLSARDAAGAEATASITITVSAEGAVLLPDAEAERTLRRAFGESEEGWFAGLRWYALGALVVLLLAGGAAWLSRPRFGPRKRLS